MFVITGAFGQTGRVVSETLLSANQPVRMLAHQDNAEAASWRRKGAEVVIADLRDLNSLILAFSGAKAAYLMNPPAYFADNLFQEAQQVHYNLIAAANAHQLQWVVALSSTGAQHEAGTGNILTTHDLEQQLKRFNGVQICLRAANFIENWAWSLQPVQEQSILPSLFLPLEQALPMVSVMDIGLTAAALLQEQPRQNRLVELHGPKAVSPLDTAAALSRILGRNIRAVAVPESEWPELYRKQGFPPATVNAFCEMMRAFNSRYIAFEGNAETRRGKVTLDEALAACLDKTLTKTPH